MPLAAPSCGHPRPISQRPARRPCFRPWSSSLAIVSVLSSTCGGRGPPVMFVPRTGAANPLVGKSCTRSCSTSGAAGATLALPWSLPRHGEQLVSHAACLTRRVVLPHQTAGWWVGAPQLVQPRVHLRNARQEARCPGVLLSCYSRRWAEVALCSAASPGAASQPRVGCG